MTDTPAEIKLPLIETISRSFKYFFENINAYTRLASLGLVVVLFDMFTNFPTLCSMRGIDCAQTWQQSVSTFLLMLISVAGIILYCRNIVYKTMTMGWGSFLRSLALYILFSIFMVLLIAIPSIVLMILYGMVVPNAGSHVIFDKLMLFIPLLIAIAVAPMFLIFPAIAVEDKSFSLKKVFNLAKGNYNRIFWGQFLMMIPGGCIIFLLNWLYKIIGIDNFVMNEIFIIVVIAVSLADTCLKASFFAHIYQFFKFYDEKK
ncbi:MAG: hypothetical protein E7010_01305 [Alphaproteobacteria bacterium]|nr:hypothetical protein [Alphaproteobacteria bacterium]